MELVVPPSPPQMSLFTDSIKLSRSVSSSRIYRPSFPQNQQDTGIFSSVLLGKKEEHPHSSLLPSELIRKSAPMLGCYLTLLNSLICFTVILCACEDMSVALKMCTLSSTIHGWVLPVIYHSVHFQISRQIIDFVDRHDVPDARISNRLLFIRNLYVGRTPNEAGDLLYGIQQWPVSFLRRLISLCTELRALTVLYLDQKLWSHFEPVLPPHLDRITLGPMHGALVTRNLTQRPPITYLTSAYTCLGDEEIEDIFKYPTMTKVRKFCEANSMGPAWAINQASIVLKAENLQEYEIIISGPPDSTEPICLFADQTLKEMGVSSKVSLGQAPPGTWVSTVFGEFLDYRRRFIASQ